MNPVRKEILSRVMSYGLLAGFTLAALPCVFAYLSIYPPIAGVLYDPTAQGLPFARVILEAEHRPVAAWSIPPTRGTSSEVGVVCIHGHGGSRADALYLYGFLANYGCELIVPALRGHQDGFAGPVTFGEAESAEIEASVRYLESRGKTIVVGAGVSMGASALILAEARNPGALRALVLDAPYARLSDIVRWRMRALGPLASILAPLTRPAGWLFTGRDLWNVVPEDEIRRGRCPILLFHGDADTNIPFENSVRLAAAAPDRVTFRPVAGAEHLRCRAADADAYEKRIVEFLREKGIPLRTPPDVPISNP